MEYIIDSIQSLLKLQVDKDLKHSIRKIRVLLPDTSSALRYEQKLNRHYFACGCQEGALAVHATLLFMLGVYALSGFDVVMPWWKLVIAFFIAALAGKITGLLISKYRLEKIYRELKHRLSQ